jgi:hypothetical protein
VWQQRQLLLQPSLPLYQPKTNGFARLLLFHRLQNHGQQWKKYGQAGCSVYKVAQQLPGKKKI